VSGPPTPAGLDAALEGALTIAAEAGRILLEGFGASAAAPLLGRRQAFAEKGTDIDLVTEFDRRAEAHIIARLGALFPGDTVLAEEGGGSAAPGGAGGRWLIDPIDGTTNFSHGLPLFCVSMGRERGGRIELGVVHAPALGLTFAARRGGGARCNGAPISVSTTATLGRALCATGFPYDRHTTYENNFEQFVAFQRRAQGVRRLGSAALDLCFVAAGTYDAYWEMKLKPWDMAAGTLLVEEAGGRVSGWRGEPLSPDGSAAVASNGVLHAAMLEVLALLPLPAAAR